MSDPHETPAKAIDILDFLASEGPPARISLAIPFASLNMIRVLYNAVRDNTPVRIGEHMARVREVYSTNTAGIISVDAIIHVGGING